MKTFNFKKSKNNPIREGLKIDKKLKNGFYYYLKEKNIDWAIIIGALGLSLPYIYSDKFHFLIIKLLIFFFLIFLTIIYLRTWNKLRQLKDLVTKYKQQSSEIHSGEKINKSDVETLSKNFKEINDEAQKIRTQYEAKSDHYKDYNDFLVNDKEVDLSTIKKLLDKEIDFKDFRILHLSFSFILGVLYLREIPKIEKKNYNVLLTIIASVFLFFLIYTIEGYLK